MTITGVFLPFLWLYIPIHKVNITITIIIAVAKTTTAEIIYCKRANILWWFFDENWIAGKGDIIGK